MIMNHSRLFTAFLALIAGAAVHAADLTAAITSGPVYTGMPAEFSITHDGSAMPELTRVPEIPGIRWVGRSGSQSTRIVNGRASHVASRIYSFIAEKPGDYTIPALEVRAGRNSYTTQPVSFKVTAPRISTGRRTANGQGAAEPVELDKLIFAELSIPGGDRRYYAGEEIPLEVRVYQAQNLRCEMAWPEIRAGGKSQILFRDYQNVNPENPKFERPRRGQTEIDGRPYYVYVFRTAVRPISFGKLELTAVSNVGIMTQDSRRRSRSLFDDFFDDPFFGGSRMTRHAVRAELPPVEISALPPRMGNAQFLGLVGKWKVETSLSSATGKVGEALTLSVDIRGDGALEPLKAPALELPGFRVYSPEVERNAAAGSARIKYILIPTREGVQEIKLNFSTFDPASGTYADAQSAHTVTVEKSAAVFSGGTGSRVIDAAEPPPETVPKTEQRGPTGVLYLKKAPYDEISVPLWRNYLLPGILLFLAGLAFWIGAEFYALHRKARGNDPWFHRRKEAAKRKGSLLNRLNAAKPEAIPEMDAEIAAYVNDCLDLPPGSSLGETAAIAGEEDRELGEVLQKLSDSSWSFGGGAGLTEEFKRTLMKKLSKLVCLVLLAGGVTLSAAEVPAPLKIATPDAAMTAYDEGHFAEAEAYYKSLVRTSAPSAKLFYNIGNCLYQQGKYAQALAYYESALRIAPRDSDVLENLNLTRRKLALPEKHRLEKPSDILPYVRDLLRPDEWMLLVFAGAALMFTAFGLRRFVKPRLWGSLLGIGVIAAGLSFLAVMVQNSTSYDSRSAVLLTRNAALHALPSPQSPRLTEISLQPGEEVVIEEARQDWVRIRAGAAEGWVRKSDVRRLWDL